MTYFKTLIHTFITQSIHSTHTTCTPQITYFHCLHSRSLILIPGPCFACICECWYHYCISSLLYLHAHSLAIHNMSQQPYPFSSLHCLSLVSSVPPYLPKLIPLVDKVVSVRSDWCWCKGLNPHQCHHETLCHLPSGLKSPTCHPDNQVLVA